jgi:hypothetical protein
MDLKLKWKHQLSREWSFQLSKVAKSYTRIRNIFASTTPWRNGFWRLQFTWFNYILVKSSHHELKGLMMEVSN